MAEKKQKKGRVFKYAYSKGKSGKGKLTLMDDLYSRYKKESKRIEDEVEWGLDSGLVKPPFSIAALASLYQNSIFASIVRQIAKDVSGLGWNVVLREQGGGESKKRESVVEFVDGLSNETSLRNLFENVLIDWGYIGYFGIEVTRNRKGEISELYRVPAHTLRVHKGKDKFCQKRRQKKVWFKKFGLEKKEIDSSSGKVGKVGYKKRANELMFYKNFWPQSDYYGVPNIISAVQDIIEYQSIKNYNSNFFENYGIPEAIVTLEGEWEDGSEEKVTKFLDEQVKGVENAHRTMTMSLPDGCKFTFEPLRKENGKESSFLEQQNLDRDNILVAYSMPPERIGIRVVGKLGGNVAEEANKVYFEKVIGPLQRDIEELMNMILIDRGFGEFEFQFAKADLRNKSEHSKRAKIEIENGVKTPNEVRAELGLSPYPEGNKFYVNSSLIPVGESES